MTIMSSWIVISTGMTERLSHAIECARLLGPLDHVLIVASPANEQTVRIQASYYHGVEIVVQPCHLDSGPEILLALARILERDPLGSALVLPSECCILEPHALAAAMRSYGVEDSGEITLFVPGPIDWLRRDAWSTFLSTGRVTSFWDLARAHLPTHALLFERYVAAIGTADEQAALLSAYRQMAAVSFTGELLAKAPALTTIALPPEAIGSSVETSPMIARA